MKNQHKNLEARIKQIERRVLFRKLTNLITFNLPSKSKEYLYYKEEVLRTGIPESIYETSIKKVLEYPHYQTKKKFCFITKAKEYTSGNLEQFLYNDIHFILPETKEKEEWNQGWLNHLLSKTNAPSGILWFDLVTLTTDKDTKRLYETISHVYSYIKEATKEKHKIEERIYASQKKITYFDSLFNAFPTYREISPIVDNEQVRIKALDDIKNFNIDYRKVLTHCLTHCLTYCLTHYTSAP